MTETCKVLYQKLDNCDIPTDIIKKFCRGIDLLMEEILTYLMVERPPGNCISRIRVITPTIYLWSLPYRGCIWMKEEQRKPPFWLAYECNQNKWELPVVTRTGV